MKNILITGSPGCGKSTLIERLIAGKRVGGISTPEVCRERQRFGFEIVDLKTGKRGILASVDVRDGPRVGKYRVNLGDLNEIGAAAIGKAIDDSEVELVVIDEVGRMECCSPKFKQAVEKALDSDKPVLAAIPLADFDPFIKEIKTREDVKTFHLRRETFEEVFSEIRTLLNAYFQQHRRMVA